MEWLATTQSLTAPGAFWKLRWKPCRALWNWCQAAAHRWDIPVSARGTWYHCGCVWVTTASGMAEDQRGSGVSCKIWSMSCFPRGNRPHDFSLRFFPPYFEGKKLFALFRLKTMSWWVMVSAQVSQTVSDDPWGILDERQAQLFCEALGAYGCNQSTCSQTYPEQPGLPPGPVCHLPFWDTQATRRSELPRERPREGPWERPWERPQRHQQERPKGRVATAQPREVLSRSTEEVDLLDLDWEPAEATSQGAVLCLRRQTVC